MIVKIAMPQRFQLKMAAGFGDVLLRRTNEVHYIGGTDVLPPPLEPEQEQQLIAMLGQENDAKARSRLIEHNLRLVVYIAKKFDNTGVGVEDLISIGTIGLIKAINTFNPDKKIKLATYASRCIENEILMYLRRNSKTKLEVSIDEPLNVDWDGNELLLSDILGTDEDVIYRDMETEAEYNARFSMQSGKLSQARADDRTAPVWNQYAGRRGKDAKGSGGSARYFPVIYFQTGKTAVIKRLRRDCAARGIVLSRRKSFYFRKPRIAGARSESS